MKKTIALLLTTSALLGLVSCRQKEDKNQIVYTPGAPAAPSLSQIDELQKTAKGAPKNAQAWVQLGNALMDAQRFSEAIDAYNKALAIEPKDVNVLVDLGTCYRGVQRFDQAVAAYRKAIGINPDFPNAHRNLGVVLSYDLHDAGQGVQELKKYLALAPDGPDADMMKQTIQELTKKKEK
jgi:cytochrome c-type biogenesis protein CcmH/NrfG